MIVPLETLIETVPDMCDWDNPDWTDPLWETVPGAIRLYWERLSPETRWAVWTMADYLQERKDGAE